MATIDILAKVAKTTMFKSLESNATVNPGKMVAGMVVVVASTALTTIATNVTRNMVNKAMKTEGPDLDERVKQAEEYVDQKESEKSDE